MNEQMVLNRVADAAIDIYGMVSVLSRASRSLNNKYSSSASESAMCQVFCSQASVRVQDNLAMAISDKNKKIFQQMSEISEDVIKKGGTVPEHPLGF